MRTTIDEAITRLKNNAEYERKHGNLQGCLEFAWLAVELEKLDKIKDILYTEMNSLDALQEIQKIVESEDKEQEE